MGWSGENWQESGAESAESDSVSRSSRMALVKSIIPSDYLLLAQNDKPAQQDKVPEVNESQKQADTPNKARDRLDDNDFDIKAPLIIVLR